LLADVLALIFLNLTEVIFVDFFKDFEKKILLFFKATIFLDVDYAASCY